MGQRERKRRVRGEAANEAVRAELEPLAPGEVPRAVKVAAVIAALIAIANPLLYVAGFEPRGEDPNWLGVGGLSVGLAIASFAMWRGAYWAVLGFQALLALTCIFSGLALLVASNLEAGLRSGAVLLAAGTMFWFLVRAMARIQMPQRPDKVTRHG